MFLVNGRIVAAGGVYEPGWLHVRGDRVVGVGAGAPPEPGNERTIDLGGRWAGPGFVDIHVHGGGGYELMEDPDRSLPMIARFLATRGVTAFLPTTYTASREDTLRVLEVIARHQGPVPGGATVLGAHMEGPYLNRRRSGGHREPFLRTVDWDELDAFLATGVVRLMAVAPEVEGNGGVVEALRRRGVTVSVGHTDATAAQVRAAVDAGATSVTHVFNGMRGLHHRDLGAAGAALTIDALYCELIADGVHVDRELMRLIYRAKGPHRVVLISDAGKAAGMPDGQYERAGRTMTVENGVMRLADGTISSSTGALDSGLVNFCAANRLSLGAAWDVVSRNPLTVIGDTERKGSLAVGRDADVTVLDEDGTVAATIVAGEVVYEAW